jgi:hypothetical protein
MSNNFNFSHVGSEKDSKVAEIREELVTLFSIID